MFSLLQRSSAAPTSRESDAVIDLAPQEADDVNEIINEEVLELEHLKHQTTTIGPVANTKEEILPQLEKQLEEEAKASASIVTSNEEDLESEESEDADIDNDVDSINNNVDYAEKVAKASENMLLKTLAEYHHKQQQQQHIEDHHFISHPQNGGERKNQDNQKDNGVLMKLHPGAAKSNYGQQKGGDSTTPVMSEIVIGSQPEQLPKSYHEIHSLTSNAQRRSNAEMLLRHSGGQYSAFDMAQYVFWTGDEAGVARAVEELIQKGLMTRENAIKFLRDIRLGIDYLQNTYSSSSLKYDPKSHVERDSSTAMTAANEFPTTTVAHTKALDDSLPEQPATLSPEILKVIEKLPSLLKLNDVNEETESTQDFDDVVGRLRLADFLYAEYSLEEVIYQLAKVMFTQSLTRGSEPAQNALEKLTVFLETEGTNGRISASLQKKILDVIMAALAETLSENPDLMKAARAALGNYLEKIPQPDSTNTH